MESLLKLLPSCSRHTPLSFCLQISIPHSCQSDSLKYTDSRHYSYQNSQYDLEGVVCASHELLSKKKV